MIKNTLLTRIVIVAVSVVICFCAVLVAFRGQDDAQTVSVHPETSLNATASEPDAAFVRKDSPTELNQFSLDNEALWPSEHPSNFDIMLQEHGQDKFCGQIAGMEQAKEKAFAVFKKMSLDYPDDVLCFVFYDAEHDAWKVETGYMYIGDVCGGTNQFPGIIMNGSDGEILLLW